MTAPHPLLDPAATRWRRHFAARLARPGDPLRGRDDLEQDLAVVLLEALPAYDPGRGPPGPFAHAVLKRYAAKLGRRAGRRRGPAADADALDAAHDPRAGRQDLADLRLDLADLRGRLAPDLARLADALRVGTVAEVARDRGTPRSSLQRQVDRLRIAFAALGGPP